MLRKPTFPPAKRWLASSEPLSVPRAWTRCSRAPTAMSLSQMMVQRSWSRWMLTIRLQSSWLNFPAVKIMKSIMAGALLEQAEKLLERGIHPIRVAEGYELASRIAFEHLKRISQKFEFGVDNIEPLVKTCMATLSS